MDAGTMLRLVTILLVFSISALAQFFSLATVGDGSRVYFATYLRQKNTSQPTYGKLFRIDSDGLTLHESRIEEPAPPVPPGIEGFGMYSMSNAFRSGRLV